MRTNTDDRHTRTAGRDERWRTPNVDRWQARRGEWGQLDAPLREALTWPAEMIEQCEWRRSLGPKDTFGVGTMTEREVWKEPIGVVGMPLFAAVP